MFICLEGIDSCGKGTQIKKLTEYRESVNESIWTTAEPTEGPIGKLIREIQKGNLIENPSEMTMMCLYAADRAEHQKSIKEHLSNKEWVITDRYIYSSEAYQDFSEKYVKAWELNTGFIKPDITFIIDIPVDEAIRRITERGKEIEIFEKKEFLEKVRNKYLEIHKSSENKSIHLIDGMQTKDEVFRDIKRVIDKYVKK